jgi:hypothetical protein
MTKKIEVTLAQLWDVLDAEYKYITMDKNGNIIAHVETIRVNPLKDSWIFGKGSRYVLFGEFFTVEEFKGKNWKKCSVERPSESPSDYSKWIGKLCVFSDNPDYKRNVVGLFGEYCVNSAYPFITTVGDPFKYCRPLTKDEVLVYIAK